MNDSASSDAPTTATVAPRMTSHVPSKIVDTTAMDIGADGMADNGKTGADRRRSRREQVFAMGVPGVIRPLDEHDDGTPSGASRQIMVVDVSLHGVGFRSPVKLERDAIYQVEIGVGPLHLSSRIVLARVLPRNDGTWDIGGEFC